MRRLGVELRQLRDRQRLRQVDVATAMARVDPGVVVQQEWVSRVETGATIAPHPASPEGRALIQAMATLRADQDPEQEAARLGALAVYERVVRTIDSRPLRNPLLLRLLLDGRDQLPDLVPALQFAEARILAIARAAARTGQLPDLPSTLETAADVRVPESVWEPLVNARATSGYGVAIASAESARSWDEAPDPERLHAIARLAHPADWADILISGNAVLTVGVAGLSFNVDNSAGHPRGVLVDFHGR